MRKVLQKSMLAVLVILAFAGSAAAQDSAPTTFDTATLNFSQFQFSDQLMRGPYGFQRFNFALPADWQLLSGAEVTLQLTSFLQEGQTVGGLLQLSFNTIIVGTVPLDWNGERTMRFSIPEEALVSTRTDGRHDFLIELNTGLACNDETGNSLIVRANSFFVFPHQTGVLTVDLRQFPRPIFQRSFLPDSAIIVIPDEPSAGELQAGITTAAALGKLTFGGLGISLLNESALSQELQTANHLIFVGRLASFALLEGLDLPEPAVEAEGDANPRNPDTGIIQMVVSPWNATRAIMSIGGDSDTAVIKAAQGLSTGTLLTDAQPNLAYVADVQQIPTSETRPNLLNSTFGEAGYSAQVMNQLGRNAATYRFYLPPGQGIYDTAYLDLFFNHSALLNYEESSLVVNLNGIPIGSVRLSDETTNFSNVQILIPVSTLRVGDNVLEIIGQLVPQSGCMNIQESNGLWLVIQPESSLVLPLIEIDEIISPVTLIREYRDFFARFPTLSNTAFVLPPDDPAIWALAARLAFELGNRGRGALIEPAVVFVDAAEEVFNTYNVILLGRPSALPPLATLENSLPVRFEAGTDRPAGGEFAQVVFDVTEETDLGFVEFFPAPWDEQRVVLAVLGNSYQGVADATYALIDPALRSTLAGNVAVIAGQRAIANTVTTSASTTSQSPSIIQEVTPESTPEAGDISEVDVQPLPPTPANRDTTPGWVRPVLFASVGLMAVTIAIVVSTSLWRHNRARQARRMARK